MGENKCYYLEMITSEYEVLLKFKESNKRYLMNYEGSRGFVPIEIKESQCIIETIGGYSIIINKETLQVENTTDSTYFNKTVGFLNCKDFGEAIVKKIKP